MAKIPKVTPDVAKRVKRANYEQPRHGRCIICGGNWDDCPHDREQVDVVVQAVQLGEALGFPFSKPTRAGV